MTAPNLDIGAWIGLCTYRLMTLNPTSPLDGTDWDDISGDLWEEDHTRTPDEAAEAWCATQGSVRRRALVW